MSCRRASGLHGFYSISAFGLPSHVGVGLGLGAQAQAECVAILFMFSLGFEYKLSSNFTLAHIYLPIYHLSICPSVCLSTDRSLYLNVLTHLVIYAPIYLPLHPSIHSVCACTTYFANLALGSRQIRWTFCIPTAALNFMFVDESIAVSMTALKKKSSRGGF